MTTHTTDNAQKAALFVVEDCKSHDLEVTIRSVVERIYGSFDVTYLSLESQTGNQVATTRRL